MKRLWHRVKTFGPSLIAYWLMTFYGLVAFSVVLFLIAPGPELLLVITQIVAVTVLGQLLGHALAFLRPRLWVMLLVMGLSCFVQALVTPALGAAPWFAVAWFLAPFTLASGFLAIRNRTEIFGAWIPVMYSVSACVILINSDSQKLAAWKAGQKFAVWDLLNVGILAGSLLLFLGYLVARQSQSLTLWQEAADAPVAERRGLPERLRPRARISWLSWIFVGALAFALTLGTALAAPFLFRTAEQEGNGGGGGDGDPKPSQEPRQGRSKPREPREPRDRMKPPDVDWDKVQEGIKQAAKQGVDLLMLLLMLLVGVLIIYFVFWRPLRRVAVLRHLERPAWPVPATQRIQDLWRRAQIALRDLDIQTQDSETVEALAARAIEELRARHGQPPPGLGEAAQIYSQVQYNLGVTAQAQSRMAAAVELLTDYTEDKLTWWRQVQNLYRGL